MLRKMTANEHETLKLLYSQDSSPAEVALASSILHSHGDWDSQVSSINLSILTFLQSVVTTTCRATLCRPS